MMGVEEEDSGRGRGGIIGRDSDGALEFEIGVWVKKSQSSVRS